MFYGVVEKERRRFRKKKGKKTLCAAKNGLVGMKGYLKTYIQPCETFVAALKLFLTETAFYAELSGWFSGPKTEIM